MALNPTRQFLDQYASKRTTVDYKTVVNKIQKDYDKIYEQIMGKLSIARGNVDYTVNAKQIQLVKQIGEILDGFKDSTGGHLKRAIEQVADYTSKTAIKDIERYTSKAIHPATWHYEYSQQYVAAMAQDTMAHVASQTDRMKRATVQMIRHEAQEVFRRSATDGTSTRIAQKRLMSQIATREPDFTFIDRAGRRWDSMRYYEMLARTVMSNTQNEIYMNTLANEGQDLVMISKIGSKDACSSWEGQVLSITGKTPGYPTMAEAKATNQIFHCRCRHSLVAYSKDFETGRG